jgi:hypothetical protein
MPLQAQQITPIDPRERELVKVYELAYRLAAQNLRLALTLKSINYAKPSALDHRIWRDQVLATYQAYHERMQVEPFPPAPSTSIAGATIIGTQQCDAAPIGLHDDELCRGLLYIGGTGSGKTEGVLRVLPQLHARGAKIWMLDPKRDYAGLVAVWQDCLPFGKAPYNPLTIPAFTTRPEHIASLIRDFRRHFYVGEVGAQILWECLDEAYGQHAMPNLAMLDDIVQGKYSKQETYVRRDGLRGISMRLHRIRDTYPSIYFCDGPGVPIETWISHGLWFLFANHEPSAFLWTHLVNQLYLAKQDAHRRGIQLGLHALSLDEALLLFHREVARHSNIEGVPPLVETLARTREFNVAALVTSQSVGLLDEWLRSNLYTRIVLNVYDGKETEEVARALGLTKDAMKYYAERLKRGQAIIRLGDRYKFPILASIPLSGVPKDVSSAVWANCEARPFRLIVPPQPTVHVTSSEATTRSANEQKRSSPRKLGSGMAASSADAASSNRPQKADRTPLPPLALTKPQHAILDAIVVDPLRSFSQYQTKLGGMHPQTMQRSIKRLLALQLIEAGRVTCGNSTGKTCMTYRPKPAGAKLLGKKSLGCRGGSGLQHDWLVHALSRCVPGSSIEAKIGDKSCDLIIPYNSTAHQQFIDCVQHYGNAFEPLVPLNQGDIIAIECEVSTPVVSGARNAADNLKVGVGLTVLALIKPDEETITKLRAAIPLSLHAHVRIVDVFLLLEYLKELE